MRNESQAIRPETTASRPPPDDTAYRETVPAREPRTEASGDGRRGSDARGPADAGVTPEAVSRFERALSGAASGPVLDPALLALQAASAGLSAVTGQPGLDCLAVNTGSDAAVTQADKDPRAVIRDLVDILAEALAAGGAFPPQVSAVVTLPGQSAGIGMHASLPPVARPVLVRMQLEPDGRGVKLTVTPVAREVLQRLQDGQGLGLGSVSGVLSLQAEGGPDQRLTVPGQRIDLSLLFSLTPTATEAAGLALTLRVPLPAGIADKPGSPGADLLPAAAMAPAVPAAKAVVGSMTEIAGSAGRDPDEALAVGQLPQPNPQPAAAPASAAPPVPPAPAVAVWEQVRAMAERMAAGAGLAGVHQIRLEIDPRLLPGVQVAIQMAAGQVQVEFFCANEASRRRLRLAASKDVDQMAERLGRTVHVTIRAGDANDAHAPAEHLHAAR